MDKVSQGEPSHIHIFKLLYLNSFHSSEKGPWPKATWDRRSLFHLKYALVHHLRKAGQDLNQGKNIEAQTQVE